MPGPCKTAVGVRASADLSGRHTHFQREERYIVVKRKHLTPLQEGALRAHINRLGVSIVEGVFVERDWPEYEAVWQMIEGPVTAPAWTAPDRTYDYLCSLIRDLLPRGVYLALADGSILDSTVIPLTATMGDLRALARAAANG